MISIKLRQYLSFLSLLISVGSFAQSPVACPGFRTWTQGGYGGASNGSPARYLTTNFAAAFPSGLEIGCTNKIRLTTATAVRNFLPQGTAPNNLNSGIAVNPTKTSFNSVFAGQLVTLTLNVRFDQTFASFGSSTNNLRDLVITSGPFLGWTVQQFLDDANKKIGACTTIGTASYSAYNNTADLINKSYDNGVSVGNILACPMAVSCSSTPALCFNSNTGSMKVNVTGGVPPYTVSWTGGATGGFNGGLSATATNLFAGSYTATITDNSGKQLTSTCTVNQPTELIVSSAHNDVKCFNGNDGSVSITFNGGTAPYMVNFNDAGFVSASSVDIHSNLAAGTYSWIVKDANGCTKNGSEVVEQPTELTASDEHSNVKCFNGNDGSVSITFNGGTAPYMVNFNDAGFVSASSVDIHSNLTAGTYFWIVKDANGCTKNGSEVVEQPTELTASDEHSDVKCFNGNDGSISITFNGGTAPYMVNFNDAGFIAASSVDVHSNLTAGTYSWIVKDANGCTKEGSETIEQPTELVASDEHTNVLCFGGSTGSASITFSGGTAPYMVNFNDGGFAPMTSTATFLNLVAGTYFWTVKDENGCMVSSTQDITITEPTALALTKTSQPSSNCNPDPCNGYASVTVSGGTTPYSYNWSMTMDGTSVGTESILENLCGDATPFVSVLDYNNCPISAAFPAITCTPTDCDPLRTYTQGGWGAVPNGNNPGTYLHANFASAFPLGITIGCAANTLSFYSAQEITAFLPKGGTPDELPVLSVLTGQLLAASLSVGFDAYDSDFAASAGSLGDRIVQSGPFNGMTVSSLLTIANDAIGGCSTSNSLSGLNEALTAINENYDNGNTNNGFLGCTAPALAARIATSFNGELYPNPATDASTLKLEAGKGESLNVIVSDFMGRILFESSSITNLGINEVKLPLSGITAKQCIVRVTKGAESFTKVLFLTK